MALQRFGYHDIDLQLKARSSPHPGTTFTYDFANFFHPLVGELIRKLNKDSLPGMLDATWQAKLEKSFFLGPDYIAAAKNQGDVRISITPYPKKIDVAPDGPYANYNWELFFHLPLTVAVHLSKSQRFAEAHRWFHYVFDPTCNDADPAPPERFWKFLGFREGAGMTVDEIIAVLSKPQAELSEEEKNKPTTELDKYNSLLENPFHPHVVARSRPIAYKYCIVMKYLDNLIAWGDSLFQQYTVETINEATQLYVQASNLLGARPQQIPQRGRVQAKTFAQLKAEGLGPIGDAMVELEGNFPLNLAPAGAATNDDGSTRTLFGIGRALYFCIPQNDKMLGYWDLVQDRLFKIRHCMDIEGVVRPLALFDPPIDPGMLVKAAAAGLDVSSIVNGLNQPIGPVRCLTMIQKALELCGEVRSLGGALLAALEKQDGEHLALIRQRHEIQIQNMTQDVRFLQWKAAQEATKSLLTSRGTALERLHYYQRLLGLPADPNAPDTIALDQSELTEENFDEAYGNLVGQYDKSLTLQKFSDLKLAGDSSPGILSGYSGSGKVYLTENENTELNVHLPAARDLRLIASAANLLASALTPIPSVNIDMHFWGLGAHSQVTGGQQLAAVCKTAADIAQIAANWEQDQAGMASRYASYERRADDWIFQYNLAAHEVMQNGRQILTSLIAEQIARHEYLNIQQQIANANEVNQVLQEKFTSEELYVWMQGEISRLYYQYYRFAFDTARKAERTMKQELMQPDLDKRDFVKFNYWDGGRKGLLSGEALHYDVKQMEMAYHDSNKRELELIRHVSLRQLNPLALLTLKVTGTCQVTVPEWLYDLDCPGHFMRRVKTVALSIPLVAGPFTSVNCTLSLLRSTLRKSSLLKDGEYTRQGIEDDRFVDYPGAAQSIVTSTGQNDSGMFETNLRDERFLPFEGAGAESTWKLDLPKNYRPFDYTTISDVILHIRYTARQGVPSEKVTETLFVVETPTKLALLLSLRHDFPTEWAAFANSPNARFTATIRKDFFPYFTPWEKIKSQELRLYGPNQTQSELVGGDSAALKVVPVGPPDDVLCRLDFGPTKTLTRDVGSEVFLILNYSFSD